MMRKRPPLQPSALPILREGDGPELCRAFCRMFGNPKPGTQHGPEGRVSRIPHRVRTKDGPYACVCLCKGFANRKPVKIMRPRWRGYHDGLWQSKETIQ